MLDGVLDDGCWQTAFCSSGFYRADKNEPATEETFAYLCYDRESIYVSFYCKDSQTADIRALETKRGGRVSRMTWLSSSWTSNTNREANAPHGDPARHAG